MMKVLKEVTRKARNEENAHLAKRRALREKRAVAAPIGSRILRRRQVGIVLEACNRAH